VARHTKAESGKLNDAKRVQSVRVCVRQRWPDGAKERPQDATLTDTHTHTWKAKAVSFAFAAAKEICSANCSNILALPRTQAHAAPPPPQAFITPLPLTSMLSLFFSLVDQTTIGGRGDSIVQMQRVVI